MSNQSRDWFAEIDNAEKQANEAGCNPDVDCVEDGDRYERQDEDEDQEPERWDGLS